MKKTTLQPLQDRVVVQRVDAQTTTAGGIVLPERAQETPQQAQVVAVGPGKTLDNGQVRAPAVKPGDRVLLSRYGGTEIKVDGQEYLVVREDDLLAVIAA